MTLHRRMFALTSIRVRHSLAAAAVLVGLSFGSATARADCNAQFGWWEQKGLPPVFPSVPPDKETDCDFQTWSWTTFVHWMQPDATGNPAFLQLPTYGDLKPDLLKAAKGKAKNFTALLADAQKLVRPHPLVLLPRGSQPQSLGSFQQAGPGGVLVDQNGRAVYYTTHMDPIYFAFTQAYFGSVAYKKADPTLNYPVGATVLKSSWRIVQSGEDTSNFYTTDAIVPKLASDGHGKLVTTKETETVKVALIGVHVVGVVENHPEFIWSTFELPTSAPDLPAGMDPRSHDPVSAQSFPLYHGGTSANDSNVLPTAMTIDTATQAIKPITNVFQQFEFGGATPPSRVDDITSINGHFQAKIKGSKPDLINPVFGNYRLTGSAWLLANTLKPGDGDMDQEAIGSIDLDNATMETFVQGVGTNCFTCHRTSGGSSYPGKNINISHIITSQIPKNPTIKAARGE